MPAVIRYQQSGKAGNDGPGYRFSWHHRLCHSLDRSAFMATADIVHLLAAVY